MQQQQAGGSYQQVGLQKRGTDTNAEATRGDSHYDSLILTQSICTIVFHMWVPTLTPMGNANTISPLGLNLVSGPTTSRLTRKPSRRLPREDVTVSEYA